MKITYRYELTIHFHNSLFNNTKPLIESFKTFNEANSYNSIIDSSVSAAYITDMVTNNIFNLM